MPLINSKLTEKGFVFFVLFAAENKDDKTQNGYPVHEQSVTGFSCERKSVAAGAIGAISRKFRSSPAGAT